MLLDRDAAHAAALGCQGRAKSGPPAPAQTGQYSDGAHTSKCLRRFLCVLRTRRRPDLAAVFPSREPQAAVKRPPAATGPRTSESALGANGSDATPRALGTRAEKLGRLLRPGSSLQDESRTPIEYYVTVPAGVTFAIFPIEDSVNHKFPSVPVRRWAAESARFARTRTYRTHLEGRLFSRCSHGVFGWPRI